MAVKLKQPKPGSEKGYLSLGVFGLKLGNNHCRPRPEFSVSGGDLCQYCYRATQEVYYVLCVLCVLCVALAFKKDKAKN